MDFLGLHMPRHLPKALLVASILTGALCAQPRLVKTQIRDAQRIRMNGHIHPLAKAENDLGSLDSGRHSAGRHARPRPDAANSRPPSTAFLTAQQDPSSPDYHRWLTPEQYADRFGASSDDIAKISAWLEQHNLHVTAVGRARTSIVFTGAAGDVEQAFQISFHRFNAEGGNHFANTAEPSLPVALQTAIRSIHGLNDFRMQPKAVQRTRP